MSFAAAASVAVPAAQAGINAQSSLQAAEVLANTAEANIDFLRDAGAAGAEDISMARDRALEASGGIDRAREPLQRFADVGGDAFDISRQNILSGQAGGPLSDFIAAGGVGATGDRFSGSMPVSGAIARRARLAGQSAQPGFNQALLGVGQTGISATGDIAGLGIRGAELRGDITRQAGSDIGTVLMGQASAIGSLGSDASNARLLGQIGQQNAITGGAEDIATLLGKNT